jgi:hypothetical protein
MPGSGSSGGSNIPSPSPLNDRGRISFGTKTNSKCNFSQGTLNNEYLCAFPYIGHCQFHQIHPLFYQNAYLMIQSSSSPRITHQHQDVVDFVCGGSNSFCLALPCLVLPCLASTTPFARTSRASRNVPIIPFPKLSIYPQKNRITAVASMPPTSLFPSKGENC